MVTARARGAEVVSVRAAHVTPHKHCGVATLDGEADGEDFIRTCIIIKRTNSIRTRIIILVQRELN